MIRPRAPRIFPVDGFVALARALAADRGLRHDAGTMRRETAVDDSNCTANRWSLMAQPLCETIVDCPTPRGSEVLVRVERCGVCHSDLHLQDGYFALGGDKRLDITKDRALPFTLGHEIAGVIEAAGPDADGAAPWPPRRCLSVDRLRHLRGVPRRRRKHVLRASPPRHRRRRRLCHPCVVPHPRYLLDYAPLVAGVRRRR